MFAGEIVRLRRLLRLGMREHSGYPKGGPRENRILFFRCLCDLVGAVDQSSDAWNAANSGW
jgi:hypothetical protein